MRANVIVATALLLVVAGCLAPVTGVDRAVQVGTGPDETSASSPSASATGGSTPSPTATAQASEPLPPGVSAGGLDNATTLLRAYVTTITRSGYVARTGGNTSVLRTILVGVSTESTVRVETNATEYYEWRNATGGPIERREQMWGNETVEAYRRSEAGSTTYERREPRHQSVLARRPLLEPSLQGGNFTVVAVDDAVSPAVTTLRATAIANETALRTVLPENANELRAFEATMQVDRAGRILRFEGVVNFSIGGQNVTQTVVHELVRLGNVSTRRPDWIEQALTQPTASPTPAPETATPSPTPRTGTGNASVAQRGGEYAG